MKLLEHAQGTPGWQAWRRTRRMASLAPAVMGESLYGKPKDVLAFYRGGTDQAPNIAMAHGHEHEHQARAYAAGIIGDLLDPVCVEDDLGVYAASLDGITDDEQIIVECKAPYKGTESPIWRDIEAGHAGGYAWQVQQQLMVTNARRCLYVVWTKDGAKHLWIEPNDAQQIALCQAWDALWADLTSGKGAERADAAWLSAVDRYRAAKAACEAADAAMEAARQSLTGLARSDRETGGGLVVARIERKGNVDYARVPQLAGVDLEAYRKPGSVSWRVDEVK